LRAARWVIGKPAGLYDMRDVLGISWRCSGDRWSRQPRPTTAATTN